MLKSILAITGKTGLFKLVTRGQNMLIVESLLDGKRMPTTIRDRVVSLADISMFTTDEDKPLSDVLTSLKEKCGGEKCTFDAKKADNEQLRSFFREVLPTYDEDRVYPSDIRKLVNWYNILIGAGINDFTVEEDTEETAKVEATDNKPTEVRPKQQQVKTTKSAASQARTSVGAKKG